MNYFVISFLLRNFAPLTINFNQMMIINMQFLVVLSDMMHMDLIVWIVSIPVLIGAVYAFFNQLRQHKRMEKELWQLSKIKRNAIEYELVLKAMKLIVWRIDVPSQTITYESDSYDSTGKKFFSAEANVYGVIDMMEPESKARVMQGVKKMLAGEIDEFQAQYEMLPQYSGTRHWRELYVTVDKRDMDGKPILIVGTSLNIDHQKSVEQELIEARNKAEESDRLKSAFLANISHEIRTPLNAIVGFSDVLPMAQSEEERNNLINLIKQNNAHLLRLFEDMVNMSKLESGNVEVKKCRFELNPLLTELANRYSTECKQKGLEIRVETQSGELELMTDSSCLREIINQYLNNALKFTTEGSITIGYEERGDKLRIWVKDTGKGIPAEYCNDHLFDRFIKVDEFVPGTGLGLSICRSLALRLDGTVGVQSKEGEGSTFWVEINKE